MDEQIIPQKRCTGPCGRTLNATAEYFHSSKRGKYGLYAKCKECRNSQQRKPPVVNNVPEGYKRCMTCKKDYLATEEFFCKSKRGEYELGYECKICSSARSKEYNSRPEVKERRSATSRKYNQRPEIQARDRERRKKYYSHTEVKERHDNWGREYHSRSEIRDRDRVNCRNRRARKRSVKGTYTSEQIQDQLKRQKHKCYYCHTRFKKAKGRDVYHVEHTFPLSRVVGSDMPANDIGYLVLACPHCNKSKHNKFPWEWPEGGRLL